MNSPHLISAKTAARPILAGNSQLVFNARRNDGSRERFGEFLSRGLSNWLQFTIFTLMDEYLPRGRTKFDPGDRGQPPALGRDLGRSVTNEVLAERKQAHG